jgi:hypothetical protein
MFLFFMPLTLTTLKAMILYIYIYIYIYIFLTAAPMECVHTTNIWQMNARMVNQ